MAKKIRINCVAVHNSRDRKLYEGANYVNRGYGDIGGISFYNDDPVTITMLFYSPDPIQEGDVSQKDFKGGYFVPTERSMELYDMICHERPPKEIIETLDLRERHIPTIVGTLKGEINYMWEDFKWKMERFDRQTGMMIDDTRERQRHMQTRAELLSPPRPLEEEYIVGSFGDLFEMSYLITQFKAD